MMYKPNIILVMADDLGFGDISCFNPESKISTPNIDRLASQGMKFTDMHSSSAVCSPSRYALMTGRYNWRSRLKKTVLPGTAPPLIEAGRLTTPLLLRQSGYKTACVGKWHLGMDWQKADENTNFSFELFGKVSDKEDWGIAYDRPIQNGPTAKGFDYFYGLTASLDQPPYVFIENDMPECYPTKTIGSDKCNHSFPDSMLLCDKGPAAENFELSKAVPICDSKVLELVDKYSQEKQPFFIYYPSLAVHGPIVPSKEFVGKSKIGPYGDFVLQFDNFIGKLMDKLKQNKIDKNTVLIVTSDNGCSTIVDIPALQSLGHNPSYQFRGAKADIWDGGHRIPFVIRWPEHIAAGTTCEQTACLVDMLSTFADLTASNYGDDAGEDSVSNLPLWFGVETPVRDFTVHHSLFGMFSIRKGDWKLEMCAGSGSFNYPVDGKDTDGLPSMQLYNLKDDIGESNNLIYKHPEVARELQAVLTDYIKSGRSTPGEPQANFPSENWPGLEWLLN